MANPNIATASTILGVTQVDVRIYTSGSDVFLLADGINVPAETTLVVLTKDQGLYINEAGKVNALASANSTLDILCSYESIA